MAERRYSRGRLLGLAGMGAGAAVGGPLLRAESAWARGSSLKVGVLGYTSFPWMAWTALA